MTHIIDTDKYRVYTKLGDMKLVDKASMVKFRLTNTQVIRLKRDLQNINLRYDFADERAKQSDKLCQEMIKELV